MTKLKEYLNEGYSLIEVFRDIKKIENKIKNLSFTKIKEMFNVEKVKTVTRETDEYIYTTNSFDFNDSNYTATIKERAYKDKKLGVEDRDLLVANGNIVIYNKDLSIHKQLELSYTDLEDLILEDSYEGNEDSPYYRLGVLIYDENNKPIGYIKGHTEQGYVFKDEKVYKTSLDEVCYIPEYAYSVSEGYTKQDFLDLCNGDERQAEILFDMVDWQYPESLYNELDFEDFEGDE